MRRLLILVVAFSMAIGAQTAHAADGTGGFPAKFVTIPGPADSVLPDTLWLAVRPGISWALTIYLPAGEYIVLWNLSAPGIGDSTIPLPGVPEGRMVVPPSNYDPLANYLGFGVGNITFTGRGTTVKGESVNCTINSIIIIPINQSRRFEPQEWMQNSSLGTWYIWTPLTGVFPRPSP